MAGGSGMCHQWRSGLRHCLLLQSCWTPETPPTTAGSCFGFKNIQGFFSNASRKLLIWTYWTIYCVFFPRVTRSSWSTLPAAEQYYHGSFKPWVWNMVFCRKLILHGKLRKFWLLDSRHCSWNRGHLFGRAPLERAVVFDHGVPGFSAAVQPWKNLLKSRSWWGQKWCPSPGSIESSCIYLGQWENLIWSRSETQRKWEDL